MKYFLLLLAFLFMGCTSSLMEVPFAYRSDKEVKKLNSVHSADEINAMESYIVIHQMTSLAEYCSNFNYEYKNMITNLDKKISIKMKEEAKEGEILFNLGKFLYVNSYQHMVFQGNASYGNGMTIKYTKFLLDNNEKNWKLEFNKLSDGKIHLECQKLKNLIK